MRAILATATVLVHTAIPVLAQDAEYGTSEEARAMLELAVTAVEENNDAALQAFNQGDKRFSDRDLYVFCGNEQGEFTAHPNQSLVGTSMRQLQDKAGEPLGERLYNAAVEGEYNEVEYMWPRPGEEEPTQKSSFVTKVDDQVCAVGYYQPE
jgi:signal transduction histidine kinase